MKVLVAWSCPTLCAPMDCSPPGYRVHRILQAWIWEWAAFPFSRGPSQPSDRTPVSFIAGRFFTIWTTREASWPWWAEAEGGWWALVHAATKSQTRQKNAHLYDSTIPFLPMHLLREALTQVPKKAWARKFILTLAGIEKLKKLELPKYSFLTDEMI